MWIIPKNLNISHFAQDMEASILDSQELSELSEQSLMWRSKLSQSKTWSRRLKTSCSTWLLFGRISKPSLGNSIVEKWISSQGAFLVSHLVEQDKKKGMKTPATSFPTSSTGSEIWDDLPLFSSKMLKESSHQSSRATDGTTPKALRFCSMSLESWSGWVTMRRREYSQRVKSVQRTKENECLSWVVAPISAKQDALLFHQCSETQSQEDQEYQFWRTPIAYDYRGVDQGKEARGFSPSLPNQVQQQLTPHQEAQSNIHVNRQESQWATPNTLDHLAQRSEEALIHQATTVRKGRKSPSNLREQVDTRAVEIYQKTSLWITPTMRGHKGKRPQGFKERGYGSLLPDQVHMGIFTGKLNPRWVEMLMGLPIGWTMPSCAHPWIATQMSCDCSEMELCPTPPNEHLRNCGQISKLDEIYEINYNAIRKEAPDLPLDTIEEEAAYAALEQYYDELTEQDKEDE